MEISKKNECENKTNLKRVKECNQTTASVFMLIVLHSSFTHFFVRMFTHLSVKTLPNSTFFEDLFLPFLLCISDSITLHRLSHSASQLFSE